MLAGHLPKPGNPSGTAMTTRQAEPDVNSGPIPLLNEYKHGLTRRRLLQTATGGLSLRRLPWFIHLSQSSLYTAPLLLGLPFVVLDVLHVWNPHYLAVLYGCLVSLVMLALAMTGVCVRRRGTSITGVETTDVQVGDDEEEDVMEFTSCFSLETFKFIFAQKKSHSVLLHPLTSGLVAFTGCFMLLPSVVGDAMPVGGVVVVCVLGWATLCNALYSLSVGPPPEMATYRPTDPLELRAHMRPFYVLVLAAAFFTIRSVVSEPSLYLQLTYAALCLLPLAWLLGVLPPLDALVPWAMEQVLTRIMGGSAMATDFRLLVVFTLSLIATSIVAVLTNRSIAVLLGTAFGFFLSQDLFSHLKVLGYLLASKCSRIWCGDVFSKTYASYFLLGDFKAIATLEKYWRVFAASVVRWVALLLLSLILVYFTFQHSHEAKSLGRIILAIALIVGYLFTVVSDNLQRIYIFGVVRNPFYPHGFENAQKFRRKRALLGYASLLRRLMIGYAYPLLLVACTGFSLETRYTEIPHIWFGITAARVLRKIWQNTSAAHFELLIVDTLHLALPEDGSWAVLGLGTQALVVGLTVDIASDFLQKIQFACTLFVTFFSDKKQRSYLPLNVATFAGSILLFPLIVIIILASSVFSVPILPLFTLPVFLPSFPRTRRFWPSLVDFGSSYSKCEDSFYYQQVEPEFARALSSGIAAGRTAVYPGSHLLLRFQDRMSVATVLELGYGYATITLRGLELQETSCHTVEATRVDDIFESVYGRESKSCFDFWLNTHFFNTLQPIDSVVIHTYSDARNVLSGIIDQPSALERFSGNLLKCTVWVLCHHFCDQKLNGQIENSKSEVHDTVSMDTVPQALSTELAFSTTSRQQPCAPSSPPDSTLSWSDSISTLGDIDHPTNPNHPTSVLKFTPMLCDDPAIEPTVSLPGLIPEDRPLEFEYMETVFSRATTGNDTVATEVTLSKVALDGANLQRKRSAGALIEVHTDSVVRTMDKALKWRDLPLRYSQISRLLKNFPQEWFTFVRESMAVSLGHAEMEQDFKKLAVVCCSLMDTPCSAQILSERRATTEKTKPFDIYRGFCGEFPYSVHLDWLKSDSTLSDLVLKAYRYAVRLLYDEASLGEVDSASELAEYLQDYDSNYFIGRESEAGWEEAIRTEKPHLFSLGRDPEKDLYTVHVLSLQDEVLHVGRLNSEAVHGLWADLSLELLYLTNDDEERYSIQAHPLLLRNLTIQAADPPLGYSVYSSGIVRIPSV